MYGKQEKIAKKRLHKNFQLEAQKLLAKLVRKISEFFLIYIAISKSPI